MSLSHWVTERVAASVLNGVKSIWCTMKRIVCICVMAHTSFSNVWCRTSQGRCRYYSQLSSHICLEEIQTRKYTKKPIKRSRHSSGSQRQLRWVSRLGWCRVWLGLLLYGGLDFYELFVCEQMPLDILQ